jgi:hypothetical protein
MVARTDDFDTAAYVPTFVAQTVHKLVVGGAISIWLIGSRANDSATDKSDWDLLVFQTHDPIPTKDSEPGIDVLRVGPSGKVLLDGQSEDFALTLSDFEWSEKEQGFATYSGKRFIEYPEMQSISSDAQRFQWDRLRAKRLWPA